MTTSMLLFAGLRRSTLPRAYLARLEQSRADRARLYADATRYMSEARRAKLAGARPDIVQDWVRLARVAVRIGRAESCPR